MYTCLCFLVCAPECLSPCPPLGWWPLSDSLMVSLHCKQFLPLCLSLIIFLIRENNHFIITSPTKQTSSWLIQLQ